MLLPDGVKRRWIAESGGHWLWLGPLRRDRGNEPTLGRATSRSARRALWNFAGRRLVPTGWRLRPTCGEALCVLPAHQKPVPRGVCRKEPPDRPREPRLYRPTTRSMEEVQRIVAAKKSGKYSYAEIAEAMGVKRQRVDQLVRRYEEHLAAISGATP